MKHIYAIDSIEFLAVLPSGEHFKTCFKLGLGPCGKTATRLHYTLTSDFLTVHQTCSDGTRQHFIYKMSDVLGRMRVNEAFQRTVFTD